MSLITTNVNGIPVIQNPEWMDRGLVHGFLGRDFDVKSEQSALLEFLSELSGESRPLRLLRQTHSAIIRDFSSLGENGAPEGDGWLVAPESTGNIFGILTADCFPVILAAKDRPLAAILHCGWRSAVKAILPDTIRRFQTLGVPTDAIEIAVGPGAQSCCYQVSETFGHEVSQESCLGSLPLQPDAFTAIKRNQLLYADIRSFLLAQAQAFSIPTGNFLSSEECTICSPRFFSFRREKAEAGRQLSFIGL